MAETVFIKGESGSVIEHDLPLPEGVADRVRHGRIWVVDKDGQPLVDEPEKPVAKKAAAPTKK